MSARDSLKIRDPLYGEIGFDATLSRLIASPALQRLRRIRLSNIDSVDSPAIAGISRYEHVLGTCHLARMTGLFRQLGAEEAMAFSAACLVHDIAITPFGHLLEEALRYAGIPYSHEEKLASLFADVDGPELGGIELQLFEGAESGIAEWAKRSFGTEFRSRLNEILQAVLGNGRWGPCVAGRVDLDNIDNVTRLAYHMGLCKNPELPVQVASRMVGVSEMGVVWSEDAPPLLMQWLDLRHLLYSNLMLASQDFVLKTMLSVAIVKALPTGALAPYGHEWTLTDDELIARMRSLHDSGLVEHSLARWISETVRNWSLGRLWSCTPLSWVAGQMPNRTRIWSFGTYCTERLGRECYAHGIPDKRHREVSIILTSGETCRIGQTSDQWLLGVVSPLRAQFTKSQTASVAALAREYFAGDLRPVDTRSSLVSDAKSLFDIG